MFVYFMEGAAIAAFCSFQPVCVDLYTFLSALREQRRDRNTASSVISSVCDALLIRCRRRSARLLVAVHHFMRNL